jgi:hypothetical protein
MRELAKRFHISDVGLKKVCIRNRIPVPPQGHWQKLRAGKQSPRIALPAMRHPPTISFKPRPAAVTSAAEPPAPDPAAEIEKKFRPVEVAETLARPHPVTSAMREELARKKPDDYGAIHCVEPGVMSARIHPASEGRLLRIADALLKGLERRGFELRPARLALGSPARSRSSSTTKPIPFRSRSGCDAKRTNRPQTNCRESAAASIST